jgi:threonyl-tRNA synthetase
VIEFVRRVYQEVFKFDDHVELSTKPEDSLGTKEQWDIAENGLKRALEAAKIPYKINPGDGAFYGPKIDIHMKDCLGRSWQLATIQLDFQLPLRFGLTYEGADGKKHAPIMVHRAVLGSLDRFMGVLIEHYAGKFPLWLSPSQVAVLTVADRHQAYAEEVTRWLLEAGLRVDLDARSESIPKKVREAQLAQYNYILVVGDKEAEAKTVAVRTRSNEVLGERDVTGFIRQLQQEIEERR